MFDTDYKTTKIGLEIMIITDLRRSFIPHSFDDTVTIFRQSSPDGSPPTDLVNMCRDDYMLTPSPLTMTD